MINLFSPKNLLTALGVAAGLLAVTAAVLLVTSSSEPERPSAVTWADPIEVASGEAYRGPWRMNESDWRFVDDPTVALTETGEVGVVWTDHVEQDLFFQRYDVGGEAQLKAPVNVSRSPDVFSWLPRMIIPPEKPHRVYVLWQEIVFSGGTHGGEIFFARSTDGGRTFSDPLNLSTTQAGAGKGRLTERLWHNGSLDLAVGPEATLYAAWTEYEGRLRFSRSTDGGRSFSEPLHVAGSNAEPARGPSLAIDATGTVHLAWTVGGDPEADIHYARSDDEGRSFGASTTVAESDGHSDAPTLAADRAGTLHLAYGESSTNPPDRYHIRYTRSTVKDHAFRAPKTISAPNAEIESTHFPSMQVSGTDTLVVLWERLPEGGPRPRGLAYTSSRNGGATFTSPSVVPGSADPSLGFNGSQQGLLMEKLAMNDAGTLAVVNSTFKRGETSHVWLYRGQLSR